MKTNRNIRYKTGFFRTQIPRGTEVESTKGNHSIYYAKEWDGMTPEEKDFQKSPGFIIHKHEIEF